MKRRREGQAEAVNADSFLDIVASIVSIMIIMVLMTGLKIKHGPVTPTMLAEAAKRLQSNTKITPLVATEESLHGEIRTMAAEVEQLKRRTAVQRQQRDVLAVAATALEQQAQSTGQVMAAGSQEEVAVGRALAESRRQLEELQRARATIENAPGPVESVESYPTPIGRAVTDHEIHFRLRQGRLAYIPLETLIAELESDVRRKIYRLRDASDFTDTVGPQGGFRLRYKLERVDETPDGRHGSFARLSRWTLIPEMEDLGETVEDALKEASELRRVLSDRRYRGVTVTIWTYPDSFDDFRRLRRELYRLQFPVACRPLPDGMPIAASPEGSRSVAE